MGANNPQESQTQMPKIFPQRISDNYKKIQTLLRPTRSTVSNREVQAEVDVNRTNKVDETLVNELEFLLNDSMPQNDAENKQRVQEYLHFHRDPTGYYQHLNDSKLRFLVLWTDYKVITNHFRIRNVIHVRWTGAVYECRLFDKSKRIKQAARYEAQKASDLLTQEYDLAESSAVLNASA